MMAPGKWGAVFQLGLGGHLPLPRAVLQAASPPVGAVPGKTALSQPLALRGAGGERGAAVGFGWQAPMVPRHLEQLPPGSANCPCCPQREGSVLWSHMELGDPNKGHRGRAH